MIGPDWRINPDLYFDYVGDDTSKVASGHRSICWRCRDCRGVFVAVHLISVRTERVDICLDTAMNTFGVCLCDDFNRVERILTAIDAPTVRIGVTREEIAARKWRK